MQKKEPRAPPSKQEYEEGDDVYHQLGSLHSIDQRPVKKKKPQNPIGFIWPDKNK